LLVSVNVNLIAPFLSDGPHEASPPRVYAAYIRVPGIRAPGIRAPGIRAPGIGTIVTPRMDGHI